MCAESSFNLSSISEILSQYQHLKLQSKTIQAQITELENDLRDLPKETCQLDDGTVLVYDKQSKLHTLIKAVDPTKINVSHFPF